jgi:uncharacterized membrane protein
MVWLNQHIRKLKPNLYHQPKLYHMSKLLAMVSLGFLLTFQSTTKAQVLDSMMEVYANRHPQE